ncbi:MAG: hypothetical protein AAFY21_13425 [Cyanobacteria bacterium J06641_2]
MNGNTYLKPFQSLNSDCEMFFRDEKLRKNQKSLISLDMQTIKQGMNTIAMVMQLQASSSLVVRFLL